MAAGRAYSSRSVASWRSRRTDRRTGTRSRHGSGHVRCRQRSVASAIRLVRPGRCSRSPASTMFGLRNDALEVDAVLAEFRVHRVQRPRVTSKQVSSVWSPSISISGSTIGTMPASWHRAASGPSRGRSSDANSRGPVSRRLDDRAPLGESRPEPAVLRESLAQPVETFGDGFAGGSASGFAPVSTLMPGMIPRSRAARERVPSAAPGGSSCRTGSRR